MSYFPTDIPFMSPEELKANGIKISGSEEPNNSKLKPCPFCGKDAVVIIVNNKTQCKNDGSVIFGVTYKIGCPDCEIKFAANSLFIPKKDGNIETVENGYKMVADAWNRRI